MFFGFEDKSVRFTGRWAEFNGVMTTTACGSRFEFAFKGKDAVMEFDIGGMAKPFPHIWILVDEKIKIEAPVDKWLRIECDKAGEHIVTVVLKGMVEQQHRWHTPLVGRLSFKGYEADENAVLPDNNRKTIEFVGDSITEGVLVDADREYFKDDGQANRPYQDDATATYAYLTAKALNLEPIIMGYGAVGVTKGGCGGVVRAPEAYPFCFENAPISFKSPDYIVINHGTNDMGRPEKFADGYKRLLRVITEKNPNSKIVCMVPFIGAFCNEIKEIVKEYNDTNKTNIGVVDTTGWLPREPIHPLRDGHKKAADKLAEELKKHFNI
ncbi:MAG: hypothetical protein II802_04485 [Clostridia bacterium]|nr:hypothetical protein [Clostridia bacterium]